MDFRLEPQIDDDLLAREERSLDVEIRVHDASRFEWRAAVPFPQHGRSEYVVDAEFEMPSSAGSRKPSQ
jgi:hypothetical protein